MIHIYNTSSWSHAPEMPYQSDRTFAEAFLLASISRNEFLFIYGPLLILYATITMVGICRMFLKIVFNFCMLRVGSDSILV
jgi:hypothetical protein